MPLLIPIREQRPVIRIGVLPPLVPGGFGELGPRPVDGFYGCAAGDTIVVRGDADDGPVAPVQGDIVCFEVAFSHAVEVPEFCEAGEDGSWDGEEGEGAEGCVEGGEDRSYDGDEEEEQEEEVHFATLMCD